MRRAYRLFGTVRLAFGTGIVLAGFLLSDTVGDFWTGAVILSGAIIGVSGVAGLLLLIAYYFILPFAFFGVFWLLFDVWDGVRYTDLITKRLDWVYAFWALGLAGIPATFYQLNRPWFFMAKHFALDTDPGDTEDDNAFVSGMMEISGDVFFSAVTLTDRCIVLDRRNFDTLVLPWKWIRSIKRDPHANEREPRAVIAMKNDTQDYLTLIVPWMPAFDRADDDVPVEPS